MGCERGEDVGQKNQGWYEQHARGENGKQEEEDEKQIGAKEAEEGGEVEKHGGHGPTCNAHVHPQEEQMMRRSV